MLVCALFVLLCVFSSPLSFVGAAKSDNVWRLGAISIGTLSDPITLFNGVDNITTTDLASYQKAAIAYVNNRTDILPDVTLEVVSYSSAGTTTAGLIAAYELATIHKVKGVSGGAYSSEVTVEQYALQVFKVPQTSGSATDSSLSNKGTFPYFFRVVPADSVQTTAIIALLQNYGWNRVLFMYTTDTYGIGGRDAFVRKAAPLSINTIAIPLVTLPPGRPASSLNYTEQVLQAKRTGYRIIVLFTQSTEGTNFWNLANEHGMVNNDFVYILSDGITGTFGNISNGAISIMPAGGEGPMYEEVRQWLIDNGGSPPVKTSISWYTFDSMYVFAVGLDTLLNAGVPMENITGELYMETLMRLQFTGTTGDIVFDENGDRIGSYIIYDMQENNNTVVGNYFSQEGLVLTRDIQFYSGTTAVPLDYPDCGCKNDGICIVNVGVPSCLCNSPYYGIFCELVTEDKQGSFDPALIPAIAVPVIVVVAIVIGASIYINKKKHRQMVKEVKDKQRSEIPRSDIQLGKRIGRGASGDVYQAQFRGTEVAVKSLATTNVSPSTLQSFHFEVAIMCGLRHPNIILFMGSCFDKVEQRLLLVMEFMGRGSLFDVLHNDKLPLPLDLQLYLAHQTAQGLSFLHQSSPPIVHCDIKSHNVLLDDKWNAKVSDFGITKIVTMAKDQQAMENIGTVYWSAPEVLQGGHHSIQSDCYSFGMVLWEIFHRKLPYAGRDPLTVAMDVIKGGSRPPIDGSVPPGIKTLIENCWSPDPHRRPTISESLHVLKEMLSGMDVNFASAISTSTVAAPSGLVCFVSTEVDGTGELWDKCPKAMVKAMPICNRVLRQALEKHSGYEVEMLSPHSMLAAFSRLQNAIEWCNVVNNELIHVEWPEELIRFTGGQSELWSGLKIKMAIHIGNPNHTRNKISDVAKYSGSVVDKTKQLLAHAPSGAITISEDINAALTTTSGNITLDREKPIELGSMVDKATGKSERIYYLLPKYLEARQISAMPYLEEIGSGDIPHAIIDIDYEDHNTVSFKPYSNTKESRNVIEFSSVTIHEPLGRGRSAEVHRATWSGKEVAIKQMTNQAFTEDNLFNIRYLASVLPRLQHPNVLQIFGMSVNPPHVAIISEYISEGSLYRFYTSSATMNFNDKLRIILAIAKGLQYLNEQIDENLRIHTNLSSNNILIGKNGRDVKISDYAIQALFDINATVTSVGNVEWSAPEVFDKDEISPNATIYAFGIIMSEVYLRKRPYAGIHPIRLLSMVAGGLRPELPPDCPRQYAELAKQCWSGNPSDRPNWAYIVQTLTSMT